MQRPPQGSCPRGHESVQTPLTQSSPEAQTEPPVQSVPAPQCCSLASGSTQPSAQTTSPARQLRPASTFVSTASASMPPASLGAASQTPARQSAPGAHSMPMQLRASSTSTMRSSPRANAARTTRRVTKLPARRAVTVTRTPPASIAPGRSESEWGQPEARSKSRSMEAPVASPRTLISRRSMSAGMARSVESTRIKSAVRSAQPARTKSDASNPSATKRYFKSMRVIVQQRP